MKCTRWITFLPRRIGRTLLLVSVLCGALEAPALLPPRNKALERAQADALFTNGSLLHIKIEIDRTNIASLAKDAHKYVPATVREGDVVYHDVAIHLKGSAGSFRPINGDKPGFTLNFSRFEASSNFHGLKKFHLNNSVQDPTFLSDWFCNSLFRAAGVPAPFCAHAFVELNGRKLGLYVLMESNNRDYLERYFKNTGGNLYGQPGAGDICDNLQRMDGKGPLNRADLQALTAACREPNPAKRWERLQTTLDIDRFLSFMAIEVMLCDWDGYTFAKHNYRIYQDLDTGRMIFFPHDKDQVMGNAEQSFMSGSGALVGQAIQNHPQGRQLYRERGGYLFTNVFKPEVLTARVDWLVAKLLPGLQAYNANFAKNFINNANGFKARIQARARGLQRQFQLPPPKPIVVAAAAPKPVAPGVPPPKAAAPGQHAPPAKHPIPLDAIKANWEPVQAQNVCKLAKVEFENKAALYIKSEQPNSVAAWRTLLVLPSGKYRFSGRAKSRDLAAQTMPLGSGGGLRFSGATRKNSLQGDKDWTHLQEEFQLQNDGPVRLVCELRANKGEIWFDLQSLKLERIQ